MRDADYRGWLPRIFAVGFVLRLAWVLAVPVHPVSDSAAYDQLAWNLASHGAYAWDNGDITAYWPVGTAFTYSLLFRLFGHNYTPVAAFNVLIGTLSIVLTVALARRWFSDKAALITGSLLDAVWPSQIEFCSVLASELLFNFALLLALWVGCVAGISLVGAERIVGRRVPCGCGVHTTYGLAAVRVTRGSNVLG